MSVACLSGRFLPRRLVSAVALAAALNGAVAAAQSPAEPEVGLDPMARHYELGQGLVLGESGFTLGGYAVASSGETGDDPAWRTALDALSGFVWWDGGGRWHFFSEFELEDALIAGRGITTTDEAYLGLERFYVDYTRSDALKFRLGKFLTPVGRWNLIHAAPLVWTTSRPLITEATFPTNATGAMVYGLLPWLREGLEYSVYASPGEELFPKPGLDTFEEAYGGHLSTSPWPELTVGFSFIDFEQRSATDERRKLYGLDFHWTRRRYEFSGEFAYRLTDLTNGQRDEQGGYLQFVAPLGERLYAVARYERFRDSDAARDLNLYLGGLNFRPRPGLALKAEYSRATANDIDVRDGFLASIAVLF
ncbi:MAG TPA: hypothetical protein VLI06_19475 [Solimonas sp.]|nr:hypothetical protein [Solimonas sp.]